MCIIKLTKPVWKNYIFFDSNYVFDILKKAKLQKQKKILGRRRDE
jgi:hypothetical protein